MKTYKLYIQFILLIGCCFAFNQQAFSKMNSFSIQKNRSIVQPSQKENLQKRLRQQRKKLKSFKQQQPKRKDQGTNVKNPKLLWTFILIIIMALSVQIIRAGFQSLIASSGAGGWIILFGCLLCLASIITLFIMYPGIRDFFF